MGYIYFIDTKGPDGCKIGLHDNDGYTSLHRYISSKYGPNCDVLFTKRTNDCKYAEKECINYLKKYHKKARGREYYYIPMNHINNVTHTLGNLIQTDYRIKCDISEYYLKCKIEEKKETKKQREIDEEYDK